MEFFYYLLAYLIGSIPFAVIVSKCWFKVDIREHGSKNPGATNTLRVLGKKAGLVVLLGDLLKGSFAAILPVLFHSNADPLYVGFLAVVGHCFPIWSRFRGGKAIATTAGVLLFTNPLLFLVAYTSFILIIAISKYVFFGSLSVGLSLLMTSLLTGDNIVLFSLFFLFLIFLHRSNIKNFLSGKEPKIDDPSIRQEKRIIRGDSKETKNV